MKLGEHYEVDFTYDPNDFGIVPDTDLLYVGITECRLTKDDGSTFVGYAFCSAKDNFERKKGRKEAFTDAVKIIASKHVRAELWAEYWKRIHR